MRCVYREFKKKMLFIKVMGKEIIDFSFLYAYNKRHKFGGVIILDTSPEFNHCDIVLDKKKTFKLVGYV